MGRTLESLRKAALGPTPARTPPTPKLVPDTCVMDWTVDTGEIPFIEVGPNKLVEASPMVIPINHAAHEPKVQPPHIPLEAPHAPLEKKPHAPTVAIAKIHEAAPMKVAYEPYHPTAQAPSGMAAEIIAYHQPNHPISVQYAEMMKQLLESMKGTKAGVLLLSGLTAGVGTSTALLNMAVSAARLSQRQVLVLDANLRRPGVSLKSGVNCDIGLQDVFAGTQALEKTLRTTSLPLLHLLPAVAKCSLTDMPSEAMSWILGWVRQPYELVFVHGPSYQDAADLAILAPLCDGTFLVAPQGDAIPAGTAHTLARMGGRLRGVLHTHFE